MVKQKIGPLLPSGGFEVGVGMTPARWQLSKLAAAQRKKIFRAWMKKRRY